MAWKLNKPLITVACNEDMTASDLVGRYLLEAHAGQDVHERSAHLQQRVQRAGLRRLPQRLHVERLEQHRFGLGDVVDSQLCLHFLNPVFEHLPLLDLEELDFIVLDVLRLLQD
jgi:hypothetical protein